LNKGGKTTCKQFPAEKDLDKYDATEKSYTGKKYPHIVCDDCQTLDIFPTLEMTFSNQVDKKDTA